jgi:hypothetical protein
MNFNGSGGLMFLIIAGLWVWVFVPSWFKRSEDKQAHREAKAAVVRQESRLNKTQRIFSTIAFLSFAIAIASIFLAVSQIFYWIVTFIFSAVFVGSYAIARVAKRKNKSTQVRTPLRGTSIYTANANAFQASGENALIAGSPVDTRGWEPQTLPAPRQRIGELQTPTLAEVVEIDEHAVKKPAATLDSTALDEILRRRRANG